MFRLLNLCSYLTWLIFFPDFYCTPTSPMTCDQTRTSVPFHRIRFFGFFVFFCFLQARSDNSARIEY